MSEAANTETKVTLYDYFMKLIPDVSIFDEIERYAIQNNLDGCFKDIFFYKEGTADDTSENTINNEHNWKRAIFKVTCIAQPFDVKTTNKETFINRHFNMGGQKKYEMLDVNLNVCGNGLNDITVDKNSTYYVIIDNNSNISCHTAYSVQSKQILVSMIGVLF